MIPLPAAWGCSASNIQHARVSQLQVHSYAGYPSRFGAALDVTAASAVLAAYAKRFCPRLDKRGRRSVVTRLTKMNESEEVTEENDAENCTDVDVETGTKPGFNLFKYGLEGLLEPQITDWRVVQGDILACFAVPNVVVLLFVRTALYSPEWARLSTNIGQPVLSAILSHGGALAICWSLGALLGRAWEARAVYPNHPQAAVTRILVAGIIAIWILLMSTELSLFFQGITLQQFGKVGYDVDMRLIRTHVDVFLDSTFSFLILGAWRIAFVRENQNQV